MVKTSLLEDKCGVAHSELGLPGSYCKPIVYEKQISNIRFYALLYTSGIADHEGLSVQIMHIGSYDDEAPTLDRMHHEFIPANGYEMAGKHHEIYLSDPRKVAPEKLKIVLRQPIRRI